ncbi:DedA family protein [uncultured Shewanella sp.]|uniref:DedA family protein n=1 Tax=uncultured Shewanella sp. TaxID=173975 RepID=UPI00261C65BB|nr:DedA family protein [uncultured Shewanella sp.]
MLSIEHLITDLTPLLHQYGYLLLALAIAAEGVGIPAPGQSLLVVASILASLGEMSLPLIITVAGSSAFLGNTCGYWIGLQCEHMLIRKNWISQKTIDKCHLFIESYGIWGLLMSRYIEGLKQLMPLACGIAKMPFKEFLVGNTLAVILWVITFGVAPAYLYDKRESLLSFYHHYAVVTWFIVTGLIMLGIFIGIRRYQKNR